MGRGYYLTPAPGKYPRPLFRDPVRYDTRMLRAIPTTCLLITLLTTPAARAGAQTLDNGTLRARFDDRGLTSIELRSVGPAIGFAADEFAITIDSQTFDSARLTKPARTVTADRVTDAWIAGPYRVVVTYELRPGWRFLSKRLAVVSGPLEAFHVDSVTVFRTNLADPVSDAFVPASGRPNLGTGDYGAAVRFHDGRGLLAAAQNPFLNVRPEGQTLTVRYAPDMDWHFGDGPFEADRGLLAPYRLTGRRLPAAMTPEWAFDAAPAESGMDEAEIDAFTGLVRAFLLSTPDSPVNVFVGWTANDYQVDVGTPDGREEYRRILDRAADVGADYVLYAPSDSSLSRREASVDDWSWEHVLWLGLGQRIRRGEWDPKTSPLPPTTREMLDYARSKGLGLLAYVYPVVPFSQNPEWIVPGRRPNRQNASLGFRSLQDWLIETLVAFHDRTGIAGYAFDHTFLTYERPSRYAQWWGWRRVMEQLRRRIPGLVIDGRQAYHLYGPWSWLAGTYPHPTFNDEQPESFVPFPGLHFSRASADRERYTAYLYRNYEFAPSELVPGYMTHQTSRSDETGSMPATRTEDRGVVLQRFRARDWDYLGWRYSVISSIAVGGWNNVIDMIPARDVAEYEAFSEDDQRWFRQWIAWTAANREYLRHTRTIIGQPAMGRIDGTSAIAGGRGYVFLFNPNARRLAAEFDLDATIGLDATGRFLLKELYPLEGRLVGKPGSGVWTAGDRVSIAMDGGSALVLALQPAVAVDAAPILFNAPGTASLDGTTLVLEGVSGEAGTSISLLVRLPPGRTAASATVNGRPAAIARAGDDVVSVDGRFEGAPFRRLQQVGDYDPAFAGGTLRGAFTVPQRILDQLKARRQAWPIPWTAEDYRTTWLVPQRLLLYVQIAEPDAAWEASLTIDGRLVELKKAYTAVRAVPRTFVGFYADLSLLEADREHTFELALPPLRPGQLQGLFFENVETEYTSAIAR